MGSVRDRAIVLLLLDTGLRVSELAGLRMGDRRGPVLYKEDHVPEGANAIVHVNLRDPFNRGIAMPYG